MFACNRRGRNALRVAEASLSILLLVGAGRLMRGFLRERVLRPETTAWPRPSPAWEMGSSARDVRLQALECYSPEIPTLGNR